MTCSGCFCHTFPLAFFFFSLSAPSAKMKQMPLEIRWETQFPTSCSGACSGRRVEILSKFHGGLAHFPPSDCRSVRRTGQELGQLSTEATSGADGEICPDNNKGDRTVLDALSQFASSVSAGAGCSSSFRSFNRSLSDEHSLTGTPDENHTRAGISNVH